MTYPMSDAFQPKPVSGTVVSTPSQGTAVSGGAGGGGGGTPMTSHTYTGAGGGKWTWYSTPRRVYTASVGPIQRIPQQPNRSNDSGGIGGLVGARPIIFFAWAGAMTIITLDEWSRNGILPRPARYWGATWVYAILAGISVFDPLVPMANLFALGYTIVLGYQYFTQSQQFGPGGKVTKPKAAVKQ